MSELLILTVLFVALLVLLYALGVHVAFALAITTIAIMAIPLGPPLNWQVVAQRTYSGLDSFILLAIPFFLFAGRLMNEIGMTEDIFNFAEEAVGYLRGGLAHVNILVSMIFSGMSGAAVADAAGLGVIEYKAMVERGYEKKLAAGVTGSSATIGPIIPPSIALIVYGVMAEVSVGALFIAGLVPGILMGVSLMLLISFLAIQRGFAHTQRFRIKPFFRTLVRAIPGFLAPVIIIGGIMFGIFTPTEAAVVATMYAIVAGVVYYQSLTVRQLVEVMKRTFVDSTVLLIIIGIANLYGFVMITSGIPRFLAEGLVSLTDDPLMIVLLCVLLFFILGTFMESLAIILITVPILAPLFPIYNIDPVWFGIIMVMSLTIGLITPPFGVILFVLERVTDLNLIEIMRGVLVFYLPLIAVLMFVVFIPDIALWLPRYFELI